MSNINLKREIFSQIKPLNEAVKEKLDRLMSDDCFENDRYDYLNKNYFSSKNPDDDLAAAFTSTMSLSSNNDAYSMNSDQNPASLTRNPISNSTLQRLQALRGLSSSNIYMKK